MQDKIVEVKMLVPQSKLANFKRVAAELFPEENPNDAASLLLSMFVSCMGDESEWTVFIPGLPNAARGRWQQVADEFARKFAQVAGSPNDVPQGVRRYFDLARERGKLDAADAVAIVIEMITSGQVSVGGSVLPTAQ